MNTLEDFTPDILPPGTAIVRYGYVHDFSNQNLFAILNLEEKERAGKFQIGEDRVRYVTCRAVLKLLLSKYVGIAAVDIQFQYSPKGKPMLPGMSPFHFNVSHCRDVMIWAISNGNMIGVDVEHNESKISIGALESVCSEAELNEMKNVPDHLRQERYIDRWTQKEAAWKILGSNTDDVCDLKSFELPGNYRAAVARRGKGQLLSMSSIQPHY